MFHINMVDEDVTIIERIYVTPANVITAYNIS
jgi:hypothetical protein